MAAAANASGEQWNVRICLAGSAPTVSTLAKDEKVAIATGFNLRLDTRRGALQCYDADPAHPWLSILHPEPRADAHFDLDLRNLPAGFAAASEKKRSKKRKAEDATPEGAAPPAKKPKKTPVPAAGTADAQELETPPKKKRPPSTKGRKKAPAAATAEPGNGTAATEDQDDLADLLRDIGPLDT